MKRIFGLIILFFLCTLFSGCMCNHTFEGTEVQKASCAQYGIIRYTCTKCDVSYEEYTPQTNEHSFQKKEILKATCGTAGLVIKKCSSCGYSVEETVKATGTHKNVSTVTKEATCENGIRTIRCSVCGETKTEVIPAVRSHNYESVVTKAATCSATGVKTNTCKVCGAKTTETIAKNPNNHSYNATVTKAATCTEEGIKTYKCSGCGKSYNETIAKTAHTFASNDCEAEKTCSVCGFVSPPGAHHFVVHVTGDKTTACTNEQECDICGKKAPPLGHDLHSRVASSDSYLVIDYECNRCNKEMCLASFGTRVNKTLINNSYNYLVTKGLSGEFTQQANGKLTLTFTMTVSALLAGRSYEMFTVTMMPQSGSSVTKVCTIEHLVMGKESTFTVTFTDIEPSTSVGIAIVDI